MDIAAILALIGDLYGQLQQLVKENSQLRAQTDSSSEPHGHQEE